MPLIVSSHKDPIIVVEGDKVYDPYYRNSEQSKTTTMMATTMPNRVDQQQTEYQQFQQWKQMQQDPQYYQFQQWQQQQQQTLSMPNATTASNHNAVATTSPSPQSAMVPNGSSTGATVPNSAATTTSSIATSNNNAQSTAQQADTTTNTSGGTTSGSSGGSGSDGCFNPLAAAVGVMTSATNILGQVTTQQKQATKSWHGLQTAFQSALQGLGGLTHLVSGCG